MNKCLITGGAGFIGYHLAKHLLEFGYDIDLVDNFQRGKEDQYFQELINNNHITFIKADLSSSDIYENLDNDYQYIFHLASIVGVKHVVDRPLDVIVDNIDMIKNIIFWAKDLPGLNKFIFTSTSEVYAGTLTEFSIEFPTPESTPLTVSDMTNPRSSYMISKIASEAIFHNSSLPFIIIRPHNIYGPRMGFSHVIPELIKKIMKSGTQFIEVLSPEHKRSFCFIEDAVNMISELSFSDEANFKTFNIGNQSPEITIKDLAQKLIDISGYDLDIIPMDPTSGSPERRCPDMSFTQNYIDYKSRVDLDDGLLKTFEWYKNEYFL